MVACVPLALALPPATASGRDPSIPAQQANNPQRLPRMPSVTNEVCDGHGVCDGMKIAEGRKEAMKRQVM